jgi:hypothetical protein
MTTIRGSLDSVFTKFEPNPFPLLQNFASKYAFSILFKNFIYSKYQVKG